jgi:hypothetical protein
MGRSAERVFRGRQAVQHSHRAGMLHQLLAKKPGREKMWASVGIARGQDRRWSAGQHSQASC